MMEMMVVTHQSSTTTP
uniref:Uncharacterized protein n=1 Tax=Arundo donax TaxID=35708 RepID=A0A0A9EJ72_ARUDO